MRKICVAGLLVLCLVGLAVGAVPAFASLPDGRQWELVSPANKHGAGVLGMEPSGGLIQAAEDGSRIAYVTSAPVVEDPAGNPDPVVPQVLSSRGPDGGWSSQEITPPHEGPIGGLFGTGGGEQDYALFSSDLAAGFFEPHGGKALPPLESTAEQTIYLRDTETGNYIPLVTKGNVEVEGAAIEHALTFEGASPDLSHVVFSSPSALTSEAVGSPFERNLYEWSSATGKLQLVSKPPAGFSVEGGTGTVLGGKSGSTTRGAVSADGSRVVWEPVTPAGDVLMTDLSRDETVQVDAVEGGEGLGGEGTAVFQAAGSVGSMTTVFFTDTERLVPGATASGGAPDLYVFEVPLGAPLSSGTLRDLTVAAPGHTADVAELVSGVSEDGSYVYFAAAGELAPGAVEGSCGAGQAGSEPVCNLYVEHRGSGGWEAPKLVAVLSSGDYNDWGAAGLPGRTTARVSPNGRYLAFMSNRGLTGYDTDDARSGVPDEEVYLYEAGSPGGSGRLSCASCDPSGTRPDGVEASQTNLFNAIGVWNHRWVAGDIPSWTPTVSGDYDTTYQSRYLSNSGRLFFDSSDRLVPGDESGQGDVYEYEPEGVGSCSGATVFSRGVAFKPAGSFEVEGVKGEEGPGCVGLISSGTASEESIFLDASASGGDVFFLTSARLVAQDVDSAPDVYDAHECTSTSPCAAPQAPAPLPCADIGECQGSVAPAGVLAAPASTTLTGAGNLTPVAPAAKPKAKSKPVRCKKGFVKKHNKCVKQKKSKRVSRTRRASK